jgi:hypothetical protein
MVRMDNISSSENILKSVLPNLYLDNWHLVIYLYSCNVDFKMCFNHYATLGFDITLLVILDFFGFSFCHIYFLRSSVIFSSYPNLKV